jgi:putative spermidine/putrescine transport system substrate-binding protein/spermidine/putrescine transport system substrate-binding protein
MLRKLIFAFLPLLAAFSASCARKTPTLNLLVWEGYADPSYVKAFEEQNHCKISASYMGSSDELVAKLRGGSAGNYDVISPSSDVATMIATSGLAAPLDLGKLPSYNQLSPQLTSLSLVRMKGDIYGVPFMWGPDPMIYDTTAFPQPPESWNAMWDPKLKGKISVWDDLSTVYMAAQVLGYDQPDPGHLYNLSDQELDAVKKKLVELKPNIRKMWSTGGELTNLFQNHEVVIAMGWPLMTNQRMDRSPHDHGRQRKQRSRLQISRVHDPIADPEKGHRRNRLHASQSARRPVYDAGRSKEPAPRRRR